jgi:predicted hydrocarbon binding protein
MQRKEFIKAACTLGVCSCAGMGLWAEDSAAPAQNASTDVEQLKGKLDFIQKRFAKLVGILHASVDEATRKKIFESLGRECAREFKGQTAAFQGTPRGFVEQVQKWWVEKAEYDEAAGTLRITDKQRHCSCPFVNEQLMSPEFCDCTLGWQKETYTMIFGKPVDVDLEESILRGGKRCIYRIRVAKSAA